MWQKDILSICSLHLLKYDRCNLPLYYFTGQLDKLHAEKTQGCCVAIHSSSGWTFPATINSSLSSLNCSCIKWIHPQQQRVNCTRLLCALAAVSQLVSVQQHHFVFQVWWDFCAESRKKSVADSLLCICSRCLWLRIVIADIIFKAVLADVFCYSVQNWFNFNTLLFNML